MIQAMYLHDGYAGKGHGLTGWYRNCTVFEAKLFNYGDELHFMDQSGKVRTARVQGKPKTWKRSPGCETTLKYRLKEYARFGSKERKDIQALDHDHQILLPVLQQFDPNTDPEIVMEWVWEHEMPVQIRQRLL